jgi:hypothetical protein
MVAGPLEDIPYGSPEGTLSVADAEWWLEDIPYDMELIWEAL